MRLTDRVDDIDILVGDFALTRFHRLSEFIVDNPEFRNLGHAACATAAYAFKKYLVRRDLQDVSTTRWIGFGSRGPHPRWVKESGFPNIPGKGHFISLLLRLSACRAGMGLAMLPCFLGDAEASLKRLSPPKPDPRYELWILTHRDMRASARIRVFCEFIAKAIISCRPQLEGLNRLE